MEIKDITKEFREEKNESVLEALDQIQKLVEVIREKTEHIRVNPSVNKKWERVGKLELLEEILGYYRGLIAKGLLYPSVALQITEDIRKNYNL